MLRSSFVLVFIRCRVMAHENPFRFELMSQTWENPRTVNRVRQPAAKIQNHLFAPGEYHPLPL